MTADLPMDEHSDPEPSAPLPEAQYDLSAVVIPLLKGVLYRDESPGPWAALRKLHSRVVDHMGVLGLDLVLDEAEGYAFMRSRPQADEGAPLLPRLVRRQPLSFPVSLLLALLRKKLAEFDALGGDTRLILPRDAVVELIRIFLPAGTNDARVMDQVDAHLNKVIELGFVRRLKPSGVAQPPQFEVRRILKAFVDAQWLADFDERLASYQAQLTQTDPLATPESNADDPA